MGNTSVTINHLAEEVEKGLSAPLKYIPSSYFYDAKGDNLFRRIMHLPEYYLSAAEFEIFKYQSTEIIRRAVHSTPLQIIELGAGDGTKTKLLLKELLDQGIEFTYYPIDISRNALNTLEKGLKYELGLKLNIVPLEGDYFDALQSEELALPAQKFILFLGSTIGNFNREAANHFMLRLAGIMRTGDTLMVGCDLKKHPQVIASAYDDSEGVTARFNLNLLERMNREMDARFDVTSFSHYPVYDPEMGEARSYLVSHKQQTVFVGALGRYFDFEPGEIIHTEISRKFTEGDIEKLASYAGLKIRDSFYDTKHYFTDVLMQK